MSEKFNRSQDFYASISEMMKGGAGCLDAIIQWCSERGVEVEVAVPMIEKNPAISALLREEAEALNYLKKSARLPV